MIYLHLSLEDGRSVVEKLGKLQIQLLPLLHMEILGVLVVFPTARKNIGSFSIWQCYLVPNQGQVSTPFIPLAQYHENLKNPNLGHKIV